MIGFIKDCWDTWRFNFQFWLYYMQHGHECNLKSDYFFSALCWYVEDYTQPWDYAVYLSQQGLDSFQVSELIEYGRVLDY